MKSAICISLFAVAAFTGCTRDHAARTTSAHYLSATSSTIGSFYAGSTDVSAGGAAGAKISIDATEPSGRNLTIYINPYAGTAGVISIASGSNTGGVYRPSSGGTSISSATGNITLTATSPDIIGTFNYIGTDGSTFSGSFNVAAP